ncbi:MAG TPA: hypothetical protein VKV04_19510 [Verrucomicrobiae bacterium]|nr:hypothetical protein [Verrucomicrobiae bacterium]
MYFADLTPYRYGLDLPNPSVVNVGWLSRDHSFDRGQCDERFVNELARLIAQPVNLSRGFHVCEFCPPPPTILSKGGIPMLNPSPGTTGNGEIRVWSSEGVFYAAPVLILHYVKVHGYRPPQSFIDAVLRGSHGS